jgi:hypothetical protein
MVQFTIDGITKRHTFETIKKHAPALDKYGQSCFVKSDFFKMKCVCNQKL